MAARSSWLILLASASSAMASSRTVLVTGATDGIGAATCRQLASQGHTILCHGRNRAKVDSLVESLQRSGASANGFVADLSLMEDVRRLGREVAEAYPSLDGLLNNAGSFDGDYTGKRVVTPEGNEYTLAVNVLAPFLLTSLLLPNLRASTLGGRVIISSSVSMGASASLGDLQLASAYDAHTAYSLSKLADAMLSQELHRRYGGGGVTFNTMDPTAQCGMGCDTKMLRAGWGNWGAPAEQSTISAEMLVSPSWSGRSGEGFATRREVANEALCRKLWEDCVALTAAAYP